MIFWNNLKLKKKKTNLKLLKHKGSNIQLNLKDITFLNLINDMAQ